VRPLASGDDAVAGWSGLSRPERVLADGGRRLQLALFSGRRRRRFLLRVALPPPSRGLIVCVARRAR
jgi:hypothetical protein